jgi:predicted MFS family arabinose efflux permease
VLRAPRVVAAILAIMCHVGGLLTPVQFTGPWLDDSGLMPRDRQWPVWLVLGLCAAAGSVWLPRYADRYGKWRFVLITTAPVSVGLILLAGLLSIEGLVLIGIPVALVAAARIGPQQALLSELVPVEQRGTVMGIRAAAVSLATGLAASGGTRLQDQHGFAAVLIAAGLLIGAAYFLVRFGVPRDV